MIAGASPKSAWSAKLPRTGFKFKSTHSAATTPKPKLHLVAVSLTTVQHNNHQPHEDSAQKEGEGSIYRHMLGPGQAPVFGAQALATDATNSASSSPTPFGAPPNRSSPSPFPHPSHQPPALGAPAAFPSNSFQQSQQSSIFGAPSKATNGLSAAASSSGGTFGGSSTVNKDATMNNPFAAAPTAPQGAASNPFATLAQTTSAATTNPFASASTPSTTQNGAVAANPFASAGSASPFSFLSTTSNNAAATTFGQPDHQPKRTASPAIDNQKRKNAFEDKTDSKRWSSNPAFSSSKPSQTSFTKLSTAQGPNGFGGTDTSRNSNGFANPLLIKEANGFGSIPAAPTKALALNGQKKLPSIYAKEILDQLRKDRLSPPPWPQNPGDPHNLKEVDDLRVKYKKYESRVRESLVKAGLIDDPNVRKKLSDAIDFRGICEDMCPEGEKVSRIVEHDVKLPERIRSDGPDNGFANPDLMVKSFKRSAAGMDSPLPTEVRSPAALRRTLDYLINDVLKSDENLPVMHGFLWDRTRAIRKDFIFQNAMAPEERMDQIYCLENIARFHAVSLHLLSKDGKEDFSEQQEREQLGKTLLSLMQVYDECKDMNLKLDNEAEFRAYYLLFNAHDPFVMQQMRDWNNEFWFTSSEIQTIVTLIDAMRNIWDGRGPLRPAVSLTTGSASFTSYFSIVENPKVSYTMACLAEIHFTHIRRQILKSIHRAYGRVRDGPKDLTAKFLNEMFRFDTEEECVDFLMELDMEFSSEGAIEPYLMVERKKSLPSKTIKQSFSQTMVERKRGGHTLPDTVHSTVFEEALSTVEKTGNPDGLFVAQPPSLPMVSEQKPNRMEISFSDDESPAASPAPVKQSLVPPPTSTSMGRSMFSQEKPKFEGIAAANNPFFPQLSGTSTTTALSSDKPASTSQHPTFPWTSSTPSTGELQNPAVSEKSQQEMPKFPMASTAPSASSAPAPAQFSNMFGFPNKPAEKIQAPLFLATSVPSSPTISSTFPNLPTLENKDKAAEMPPRSGVSATKTIDGSSTFQGVPTPPTSIFSTAASSAPAATPSLFAPGPPKPTSPATQSSNFAKPTTSLNMPTFSLDQALTQGLPPSASQPPAQPRDLMGDLAKWVLLGDGGLMEKLQDSLVENVVRQAFEVYHKEEEERKRREEDERSWAEARKFRRYSLRVKFFYRWRETARRQALRRVGQQNRHALKAYREAKAAEARAARKKKEKEEQARQKRLSAPSSWLDELEKERALKRTRRESMSLGTSRRSSPASDADALLATGIFGGMPNQQKFAADCVRDDDSIYDALVGVHISPNSKRQVMGPPAKPIKDPLRSVRDAGISKPVSRQKWSKKAQALADMMSGKRKDDDLISFRSSTSSRLGQSVRSVPAGGKLTNFSKYQSSSPRSSVDLERPRNGPSSGIKSSYWLLRSRGLFATPTGHVLSDKAPRPRAGSFHDGASQYSGDSEVGDYDDRVLEQDGAYRASLGLTGTASRRSTFSVGAAGSPPASGVLKPKPSSFRQSLPAGGVSTTMLMDNQRGDGDVASQAGSAVSTLQQDVEETLRELRKVAAEMEDDTNWYREQNRQMSQTNDFGS